MATTPAAKNHFIWENASTKAPATIDAGWRYIPGNYESQYLSEFRTQHAIVIFAEELGFGQLSLADYAAALIEHMDNVSFDNTGRFTDLRGQEIWTVTGYSKFRQDVRVTLRIVKSKGSFWRTVSIQEPPFEKSDKRVEDLERALWTTVLDQRPRLAV